MTVNYTKLSKFLHLARYRVSLQEAELAKVLTICRVEEEPDCVTEKALVRQGLGERVI